MLKTDSSQVCSLQTQAVVKASPIIAFAAQGDQGISSFVLSHVDYNEWFQPALYCIVTWYPDVSRYNCTVPFYSQYVLIWIQNICVLFPQHSLKRAPQEAGFICGDLFNFPLAGHKGWLHLLGNTVWYPPVKLQWGQDSNSHSAGIFKGRINVFLEDLF